MFDISSNQLLQLTDVGLRELVARLCESELRRAGAPVSAVRWGGSQTAPDGGLDVEIRVKDQEFAGDFVPRAWTGIQVKKSSMPASEIAKEMSPESVLRPIFPEIARHNGCYIIVNLADDPAGTHLSEREKAMQAQVESIKDQGDLRMEFYGRGRLADWLRQHPGVQLWVREKLGLQLSGWRPHGRWSATPRNAEDGLICEGGVVIRLPGREQDELGIAQGIEGIRELVRNPDKAVRIVGLSGVGKSRIVQALFEETVGNGPLPKHLAIYADLGEAPDPSARTMLERLAAEERRAIMVLDNCPSDIHDRLAHQVASLPNLRLITVEYDIREDKPEVTSVVRVDAEGPKIAEMLIRRRHPALDQVNARQIAEFSGGNARVALVLADAASEEEESLSSFSPTQLFKRLFYQRGAPDQNLLKAAEVLVLVYSFSIGENEDGVDELATLAGLLDQGGGRRALYRAAQTLLERQLAQKRGNWRAVLPHAVANRLAASALRNIPVHDILNTFQGLPSPRLLKSFGKRLGYLHDHEVAQDIVRSWLSPDGLLHDLHRLNDESIQLLQNVAPVDPDDVLAVIESQEETFFSRENPHFSIFVDLLVKIAYDSDLFERCVNLLAKFALTEEEGENRDSIQNRLFGLFSLYLSGTHAGLELREGFVRRFLLISEANEQRLGLGMLKAALESHDWSSFGTFEFGARPRDFGYQPKTREEETQWFARFITLSQEAATGAASHVSARVRSLFAEELRVLWYDPGLRTTLADLARALNEQQPWLEGWRAVLSIKRYDHRKADGETLVDDTELLTELDEALKPRRLSDEVRICVLGVGCQQFALDEEFDCDNGNNSRKAHERAVTRAYNLGTAVAGEPQVMEELSQEFFTAGHVYLFDFGRGLASKWSDLRALWDRLVECLELAGDQATYCGVLTGVLEIVHQRDESLAQEILDEAVQNSTLRKIIVSLQVSVPLDHTGISRLERSLDFVDTPLPQFGQLAWHRLLDTDNETHIRDLMGKVLDQPDSAKIVLEGLATRLRVLKGDGRTLIPDLMKLGLRASAALLRQDAHCYRSDSTAGNVSEVLTSCLNEAEFPQEVGEVFDAYLARVRRSYSHMGALGASAAILAEKATFRFLDGVFLDPDLTDARRHRIFREGIHRKNPLANVCVEALLDWCRQGDFQERLSMLSGAIYPFEEGKESDGMVLSEQARAMVEETPDPWSVLRNLGFSTCHLRRRRGSLADVIATRRQAFEALLKHERSDVREAASAQIAEMKRREELEQRYEQDVNRREQCFE